MIFSFLRQRGFLVFLGAVLGLICGISGQEVFFEIASVFSELFVNFLKLVSLPLIFLSVVSSIGGLGTFKAAKQLGSKILGYTLLTTT